MSLKIRLLTVLLRGLSLTSLKTQRWFGRQLGNIMLRKAKRSLMISQRNIAVCFPEFSEQEKQQLCNKGMQNLGMGFTELACGYYWPAKKLENIIASDDDQVLQDAFSEGKGVILASPHFGNWEMTGQFLALQHQLHILYRPSRHADVDAYILERRSRLGTVLQPTNGSGVRGLSKALKNGEIIGILPDQEPDLEGGVFAPFFGRDALTMTLLNKLAKRRKTPVLLTYMRRTDTGFALHFDRLGEEIYADDMQAATALNQAIEHLVRTYPEQYIWNYRRFETQPKGVENPYQTKKPTRF